MPQATSKKTIQIEKARPFSTKTFSFFWNGKVDSKPDLPVLVQRICQLSITTQVPEAILENETFTRPLKYEQKIFIT